MEQPRSWLNIIKLGKSEVIRQLKLRGLAIQEHSKYWQLCSSLYQIEQAQRFELLMNECDQIFLEAEAALISARKYLEELKRD